MEDQLQRELSFVLDSKSSYDDLSFKKSPPLSNQLQREFSSYWQSVRMEDDVNIGTRVLDHSMRIADLKEKYSFSEETGLDLTKKKRRYQGALLRTKFVEDFYLHTWRVSSLQIVYRISCMIAAVIFFSIYLDNTTENIHYMVLSGILVVLTLASGFLCRDRFSIKREGHSVTQINRLLSDCIVIREGKEKSIASCDVFIGDVIVLRAGVFVPVDARVIQIEGDDKKGLTADWGSSLPRTRESRLISVKVTNPTDWRRSQNVLLQGQLILTGSALAVALNTFERSSLAKSFTTIQNSKVTQFKAAKKHSRRKSVGAQFRSSVMWWSVAGLIVAIVCGLLARYALSQSEKTSFIIAASSLIACLPIGLMTSLAFARWLMRSKEKGQSLYEEDVLQFSENLTEKNSSLCCDLRVIGDFNQRNVAQIWIDNMIYTGERYIDKNRGGGGKHKDKKYNRGGPQQSQHNQSLMRFARCMLATQSIAPHDFRDSTERQEEDKVLMSFFNLLYEREGVITSHQVTGALNSLGYAAIIPPHELLSFSMRVVKEQTEVGDLVAYIRGEPAGIIEACSKAELRGFSMHIDSRMRADIKHALTKLAGDEQPSLRQIPNKVIAFARLEIVGNSAQIYRDNDLFINAWGDVDFSFSGFSLIAMVGLSRTVQPHASRESLGLKGGSPTKLLLFSPFDFKSTLALTRALDITADPNLQMELSEDNEYTSFEEFNNDDDDKPLKKHRQQSQQQQNIFSNLTSIIHEELDVVVLSQQAISDASPKQIRLWLSTQTCIIVQLGEEAKKSIIQQSQELVGNTIGYLLGSLDEINVAAAADATLSLPSFSNNLSLLFSDYQMTDGEGKANVFKQVGAAIQTQFVLLENLRKLFAYHSVGRTACMIPIFTFIVFQIPLAISPLFMVLLMLIFNFFPAVSLVYEEGEDVKEGKRNSARVVTARLAWYAHFFLGFICASAGLVCYFTAFNLLGVPPASVIGSIRRDTYVPINSYLRGFVRESVRDLQLQRVSSMAADEGTVITSASPYYNSAFMSNRHDCVADIAQFSPEKSRIDWLDQKNSDLDMRKMFVTCDAGGSGEWLTTVDWGFCSDDSHCYDVDALLVAQTSYLTGVVLVMVSCAYALKSLRRSFFMTAFSWKLTAAVGAQVILLVVFTVIPGIKYVVAANTSEFFLWTIPAAIFSILTLVFDEVRKALAREFKWIKEVTDF